MKKGIDYGFAIVLGFIISYILYYATGNGFWRITGPVIAIFIVTLFSVREEDENNQLETN
jgi:uncharacterized membrane protein YgaE (UPF0421/DUF939 family)